MMGRTPSTPNRYSMCSRHMGSAPLFMFSARAWNGWERPSSKRMGAEGHSIGNHSYSHADLVSLSETEVRDEITKTDALIGQLTKLREDISSSPRIVEPDGRPCCQGA